MMSKMIEPITFTVPLSFEAHDIAQQCAEKSIPTRFKQVYLNTLAVYAVDSYLRCMGFETNLEKSESRDSLMLKFVDVADLDIVGVGKIECRPVLPDSQTCNIPSDAWENRIGYVAVQLNQSLKEATLLGFTRAAVAEIPVAHLSQLDNFLGYLSQIKQTNTANSETNQPEVVNLKKWFEGIIDEAWLTVEQLLNPRQVEMMFRFKSAVPIVRGQQIDLGMELAGESVALLVTLPPQSDSEVDVTVQVHPIANSVYLPAGLQLMVQDESGETVLHAESRDADNFIQLQFSAELGECFGINVTIGEASVTEKFCL
ncbi:MAG: DUF1822 family protein [Microcoleus sp. PH2017_10_PVI_O_A]|uniref:DUF1822 family protein n=1 Tax=unclassified Microcoleus TaxID=2642155 RepID=UPI001D1EAA94|nr:MULTISPECIES: DUF1822 family protein [unclassified Microcoleus]TAE84327.1 MAG: DUF1822 family protein [Oscillatoriales cyanobacterium]MCC3405497.1 DUF1822 family protein [Microcoleus sp. PH2017_10_PVI_O_A]MCC3461702.1 DUF1822 family protein [Microcoleus sp. PH2017_11_PCY_U_A]MCC3477599.1 DUF1822 family protein [Microcoleus sp. PH2017_12_PCY_D_A]MCC3529000.1 DUF1822 family protein [Microcoleus sp. PH2017_21_RUC_O_A]